MPKENRINCAWIHERIEPWIDGDLGREDSVALERHIDSCSDCAAEIEFARSLSATLRSLPVLECPPGPVERAMAQAGAGSDSWIEHVRGWFRPRLEVLLRPAMVAMILVVAATGVFVLSNREGNAPSTDPYTVAEMEVAAEQARIAFAYVGKYSRRTGRVLRQDIIAERVAPRMAYAMSESQRHVMEKSLVPAVEEAVLNALFVETRPRIIESYSKEGRPK